MAFIIPIGLTILVILLLLGIPIFAAMGGSSLFILTEGMKVPATSVAQSLFINIDVYTFVAIPLFIFAGTVMTVGGASRRLVDMVQAFVGHLPGGMGTTVIIATAFFAALSGSTPATVAAIGTIMLAPMLEKGFKKSYVTALIACSGTLGVLIPPSIPMLVYAGLTEQSGTKLFMAGIIPGILQAIVLTVVNIIVCKRNGYPVEERVPWKERWVRLKDGIWILGMPIIILGGIYSGKFTPTESAAIAVIYGLVITSCIYRELTLKIFLNTIKNTARISGMILAIISFAVLFGKVLTGMNVPQYFINFVSENFVSTVIFLLMVNLLYIIMGMFLDTVTIMVTTIPIFFPVLSIMGIDPIHFAIIMVINMELAVITPPIGVNLYVMAGIAKTRFETVARGIWPFFLGIVIVLLLVTYIPYISLFLPKILG